MIPPKYKFYVGTKASSYITWNRRQWIGPDGTLQANNAMNTSSRLYIQSGKSIFINIKPTIPNEETPYYHRIAFFASDGTFLGKKSITNEIIAPLDNTAYFTVEFYRSDTAAHGILNSDTFSFISFVETVNPHYKELSKKYSKESGQEFFRISLDGKINLFGEDYDLVNNSGLEDLLVFIVEKYSNELGAWSIYYKGEFNKTDCKLDYDKRKCELKTTAIDEYNEIMNKYENTYDLIKLAPEITRMNLYKRSLMQVYIRGANSISNFFGGIYWEDDVNEAIDSHDDLINKYYFAYIQAGNEFYVNNAGISEVNGVYAGINGNWNNWNGYTCYMGTDTPMVPTYIYIKRNSDNTILYQSAMQYMFTEADNCYIGREDIVMVNVNDESDTFTIESPFVYHIYRRLLCDVDTVEDSEGVKNTYDVPSDDFATDNRNYKKCIGLRGGLFFCTSRTVSTPTRYGLNDYGQYFTNQFIPASTGLGRALPISRNSWANASLWYVYDNYYVYFEERLRKRYTLRDSYSIAAVIKALLNEIDPTIMHEATAEYSQFLYDTTVPLSSIYRFYVYITQKTNILKGEYDQPAQKAEISFDELMKMLRDCFRCYWYIEDNKLKIEHISFFNNGGSYSSSSDVQLDFTKLTDQFNKKLLSYFQTEVEYDKSDLNQRYEFGWMDDVTDLFGGVTIDIKSNYIQKDKTEEITVNQFSSDVDYMLFNPSNFSDDGFALLCPIIVQKNIAHGTTHSGAFIRADGSEVAHGSMKYITMSINPNNYKYGTQGAHLPSSGYSGVSMVLAKDAEGNIVFNSGAKQGPYTMPDTILNLPITARQLIINSHVNGSISVWDNANTIGDLELPIVETQLFDENGNTYNAIIQNIYASWVYLIRLYAYDMPAMNTVCNAVSFYPIDIKRCKKHTIEFPTDEDLDELKLIKTSIGNGKIDEASINMNTRHAKVRLLYKP